MHAENIFTMEAVGWWNVSQGHSERDNLRNCSRINRKLWLRSNGYQPGKQLSELHEQPTIIFSSPPGDSSHRRLHNAIRIEPLVRLVLLNPEILQMILESKFGEESQAGFIISLQWYIELCFFFPRIHELLAFYPPPLWRPREQRIRRRQQ